MSQIEIVSASAGSGKTTYLADLLRKSVVEGSVRPDAVLATTFTVKAAAELKQRVRTELLSAGRAEDAARLEASRIGTVNSVCAQLVADFAFELGLSPKVSVIDEGVAKATLQRALSDAVTPAEMEQLMALSARMSEFEWHEDVGRVIELARQNLVPASRLHAHAERSLKGITGFLGTPRSEEAGAEAARALAKALETFVATVDRKRDPTGETKTAHARAQDALNGLERDGRLPWSVWLTLSTLKTGVKSKDLANPVREAAAVHDELPALRQDLEQATNLVFGIAARALGAYDAEKREWGVLDFTDQEVFALQLLELEPVQERLRSELDLVLVDEFQDTSPLQLAIFLKLSKLARRSIWVGDQKQAIYGFRGADPRLMDAVLRSVLKDAEPVSLDKSHRSRPGLVALTSELFAPAFEQQGIPAQRTRLRPARDSEAKGLGCHVEHWQVDTRGNANEPRWQAVAEGVRQLLADRTQRVRVRDGGLDEVRPLRPSDVAILCRQKVGCADVARALSRAGLKVAMSRAGLLATPEAQVAVAGLRLFVDPRDSLAAAEISLLTTHADSPEGWLTSALEKPNGEGLRDVVLDAALSEYRASLRFAGALGALDAAIESTKVLELCKRWGDSEVRTANLDALRGLAAKYAQRCAAEGTGFTPAGLLAHFDALQASGGDAQSEFAGDDAVVVSTWHASKGLEWPVTILTGLEDRRARFPFGVALASDESTIELEDPLRGRWIRYWPSPFRVQQTKSAMHSRMSGGTEMLEQQRQDREQDLRLLYVGWTRARDRVVVTGKGKELEFGMLELLSDGRASLVEQLRAAAVVRVLVPGEASARTAEPEGGYDRILPARVHLAKWQRPSAMKGRGTVVGHTVIGPRLGLTGKPHMNGLGQAVHAFFAVDWRGESLEARAELAREIFARWSVSGAIAPEEMAKASAQFEVWVEAVAPGARWHREWPVSFRDESGAVMRGTADLVLEMESGFIVVDHKSFPGDVEAALERGAGYADQLGAYTSAIETASARQVQRAFVHLPVSGLSIEIRG